MSSLVDRITISDPTLDKRVKLLPYQKEEIIELHKQGTSVRHLARSYSVSRRLIQFIVHPERKERDLQLRQNRGGSKIYYDKEKHKEAMQRHRLHKKAILQERLSKNK